LNFNVFPVGRFRLRTGLHHDRKTLARGKIPALHHAEFGKIRAMIFPESAEILRDLPNSPPLIPTILTICRR
jgi:hypothetical protein